MSFINFFSEVAEEAKREAEEAKREAEEAKREAEEAKREVEKEKREVEKEKELIRLYNENTAYWKLFAEEDDPAKMKEIEEKIQKNKDKIKELEQE